LVGDLKIACIFWSAINGFFSFNWYLADNTALLIVELFLWPHIICNIEHIVLSKFAF